VLGDDHQFGDTWERRGLILLCKGQIFVSRTRIEAARLTGLKVEDEVEARVGHGQDWVQLELRLEEIEIRRREYWSIR
jgi:hypothetical protein